MNLKELEEIILQSSSNLMKKWGRELFLSGEVLNIKGRKIDNIYHIYGETVNDTDLIHYKTHLKIDLLNKKLVGATCSCDDFKSNSIGTQIFMCKHLTASAYKFLNSVYKKSGAKKSSQDENGKAYVGIDVKLSTIPSKEEMKFETEFRVGEGHKYLITNLKKFIFALENKKVFSVNNQFIYSPSKFDILPSDKKVINFIKNYCKKENLERKLIIKTSNLREFLECIDGKKIQFKYNGLEYKAQIIKADLPLSFTLKALDEGLILTTHKKLPIPLNESKSVWFFKDSLYLPSKNQILKYSSLYDKFVVKEKIAYNKTFKNYNALIYLLSSISEDITITEGVKKFAASNLNFNFFIYKFTDKIYCKVYGIYNGKNINILEKNSTKAQPMRIYDDENKVIMKLERYKFIKNEDKLVFNGSYKELMGILIKKGTGIYSLGNVTLGSGFEDLRIYDSTNIEANLYEENGSFKLNYSIGDIDKDEFQNIFNSYKANDKFYMNKNNKLIDFEEAGIKEFFDFIDLFSMDKDNNLNIERSKGLFAVQTLKKLTNENFKGSELLKDIEDKIGRINSGKIKLPKDLKASLRKYQLDGFKWLKNLKELGFGGILADEMGLGKTVQTIAFLTSELGKKALIITPTSLIYNWKSEIDKFAPILKTYVAHGTNSFCESHGEYDVILTTYGTLRNNIEKYRNIKFDYCIIDEAQNIKNYSAETTKVVKEINSKIRFALTGTPIENNLLELWSIFDFVMPGYLYSKDKFCEKFVAGSEIELEDLKLLIKPFILRRTKSEVIKDLPDKIEKKMLVPMTAAQKLVYNSYLKSVREKLKAKNDKGIEILSYLMKLRQICLDPALILEDYKGGSGKFKVVIEMLQKQVDSNGKTLLFSQFTSVLKEIAKMLKEKGIEYLYLDGAIPPKERISLANEFNNSSKPIVFLISLKAGGTGLNLTAANLVIHFDPWWNPAVENQATDRAHRIGQKNVVQVVKLVARETIEEKIVLLQESKKELIENVITGELQNGDVLNKFTKEEIMELFER
ncbi:DEAD/DEAH box helicase [Clostridium hydrogenum]|uniref:DEAD/DEAH box helicase n=1 Tax=Clostridium hydrogenum TaxID=2855764 RepID=UPI002E348DDC|nr:SNF2-related protein [Clostridium hydrogenum]